MKWSPWLHVAAFGLGLVVATVVMYVRWRLLYG